MRHEEGGRQAATLRQTSRVSANDFGLLLDALKSGHRLKSRIRHSETLVVSADAAGRAASLALVARSSHEPRRSTGCSICSGPGDGRSVENPTGGVTIFKAVSDQSGGGLTVIEGVSAPGEGPPLHVHREQDEFIYTLDGTIRVKLGDDLIEVLPRSFVFIPRNTPHTWQNVGEGFSRFVAALVPASVAFEEFFHRYGELSARGARNGGVRPPRGRDECDAGRGAAARAVRPALTEAPRPSPSSINTASAGRVPPLPPPAMRRVGARTRLARYFRPASISARLSRARPRGSARASAA